MAKAKVFMSGGSQAVRLPAEYRFDCKEVEIRRDPLTGDVVISRPRKSWDDFFDWLDTIEPSPDFLQNRHQPVDDYRNPFEPSRSEPTAEHKPLAGKRSRPKK